MVGFTITNIDTCVTPITFALFGWTTAENSAMFAGFAVMGMCIYIRMHMAGFAVMGMCMYICKCTWPCSPASP